MKKILFLLTLAILGFSYKAQACHYADAVQVGNTINNGNGTYTFTVQICQGYGIEGTTPNGSDVNGNGTIALAGIDDTDGFRVVLTGATFAGSGFPATVASPDMVNGNSVSGALSGSSTVLYTGTGLFIDLQAVSCVDNTCTQAGANSLCWNMTFTTTGLPSNVQINGIEDNTTSGSGTQSCPLSFRPIAPCPIYTLNPPTAVCSGGAINFPFTGTCSGLDATASSGPVIDIFYYDPAGSGGTLAPAGYESTINISAPTETFEDAANNPQGIDDKDPNLTAADWDISCSSPGSFGGFTNETCQPITVTFFAVVFDYSIDSDGDTRAEYNPNCSIQRYDVTIYPAPFTAVPVVGACEQAASIELQAADGSVCDSQIGTVPVRPACTTPAGAANDNQPLSYSWDVNAIATIMGVMPVQIPTCFTSTSFSGTVTANCLSLGCPAPTCPSYGAPVHTGMACSGQQYSVEIPNTSCPALANFTITFDPGSSFNYEFAWELINNATNAVVASGGNADMLNSGGPGNAGGNNVAQSGDPGVYPDSQGTVTIPITVNPAIDGQSFTIYLYSDDAQGFQGTGGFFTITSNNPAATILYDETDASLGNFDNTNLGFTAPLYNASDISIEYFADGASLGSFAYGPCADATSFITLTNPNFCTTIVKTVTYELTCDDTGEVIQAGTFDVTVYPSLPTSAADLVTITIDPLTCNPVITPNNDCNAADIGSTFTVTLAPPPTPTMGTSGTAHYDVVYNGIAGGPNCCATGGPSVPFTFTTGDATAVAQASPFGGVNNSAYTTTTVASDPNSSGAGNAISGSFQVVMTGYSFPNPPGTGTNTSYWVTIMVDGTTISDVVSTNPGPATSTTTITLAQIAAAGVTFDENSVIEVWIYPNSFSGGSPVINTTYVPGGPANDEGEWTATSIDITNVSFTYDKLIPTPADCDFIVDVPFNCPTCTASINNPTGTNMVLCGNGGALIGTDAATTTATTGYTNLYLLVNNLDIIVATASSPAALVAPANTPAATCVANTDDTYTVYALQYQDLQGIDITAGSTTLTSIADADGDLIGTSPTLSACMDLSAPGITVDVLAPMIVNTEVLACSGGTYSVNVEACGGSTTTFADLTVANMSAALPGTEAYSSWVNIADNLYRATISNIATDPSGATITVTVSSTGGIPVCTGTSTFVLQECSATCPTATTVTDDTGVGCGTGSTDDLSTWQTAVAAANPNGLVYATNVIPDAGVTLPDGMLVDGLNSTCGGISQTTRAYVYCDV
ncbi:MAG: hypothetical protein JNM36_15375, partial [Chitinophagales bacterium]|nr:hypothetical protein [Chitinophagales bacterium]